MNFWKYIVSTFQRTFDRPHIFKNSEDTARWTFVSSAPYGVQRPIRGLTPYSEISISNPQTRYFQKNVKWTIFKNGHFWGYDLENWVWAKLVLWICPILWISPIFGYTQLSLTFFHEYRPIRPICHTSKKIIFLKKWLIFGSKMCSRRANSGSIRKPR